LRPELIIELQCMGVCLMYRSGARVTAFYNFVLDANDLL